MLEEGQRDRAVQGTPGGLWLMSALGWALPAATKVAALRSREGLGWVWLH